MQKAICHLAVVPVRAEPSDTSEIVTQLMYGDLLEVIQKSAKPNWIKIKSLEDDYEGWIDPKQVRFLAIEEYNELIARKKEYVLSLRAEGVGMPFVPLAATFRNATLTQGNLGVFSKNDLLKVAMLYMGSPYLWGGKTQAGIDCSGYVQQVFKLCGISLPRDASQQALVGAQISLDDAGPGDLAFFSNENKKVIHVGILTGRETIFHAHGMVKENRIDHAGIKTDDGKDYSHLMSGIRRVI